jgi:hypothetical protein
VSQHTRYMTTHTLGIPTLCAFCGGYMAAGAKAVLSLVQGAPWAHRNCSERRMCQTQNDWIAR